MPTIMWDNMNSTGKIMFIETYLPLSFQLAMQPQNQGVKTPRDIFKGYLSEVGQDDYSGWYSANFDWIPGRIAGQEALFGFKIDAYYIPGVTDSPIITGEDGRPPQTGPGEGSWFARNYLLVGFIVIALATVGYFIYKKMKK